MVNKMSKKNVLAVPVDDYSFEKAQEEGYFAEPSSYGDRKGVNLIAFYRTEPISAITHYAKVEDKEEGKDLISGFAASMMFPNRIDEEITKYNLGELQELEEPVDYHPRYALQSAKYTNLELLKDAETTADI